MKRIPFKNCLILALIVAMSTPATFTAVAGANASPAIEDLNIYQLAPKKTWYVNETINFTLFIINSLHDEPFYNVSFNHGFRDEFVLERSTNSSMVYNGTWAHNVTYFWDEIQPNETLIFWVALRVTKAVSTTISRFQINYQLEDSTPKAALSSNNWDITVVERATTNTETNTEDDGAVGPGEGNRDYSAPIIILGFILPIAGFVLTFCAIYIFRIKRHD